MSKMSLFLVSVLCLNFVINGAPKRRQNLSVEAEARLAEEYKNSIPCDICGTPFGEHKDMQCFPYPWPNDVRTPSWLCVMSKPYVQVRYTPVEDTKTSKNS